MEFSWFTGAGHLVGVPFAFPVTMWMDKIRSHQFETMENQHLLVLTGESPFQDFSGDAGFRPSTVLLKHPTQGIRKLPFNNQTMFQSAWELVDRNARTSRVKSTHACAFNSERLNFLKINLGQPKDTRNFLSTFMGQLVLSRCNCSE